MEYLLRRVLMSNILGCWVRILLELIGLLDEVFEEEGEVVKGDLTEFLKQNLLGSSSIKSVSPGIF